MVSAAVVCLPAAVSLLLLEALFMQISVVSFNTHLALQALFTQSSLVCEPLLQAFPFPSTLGEVTLHLLSQACMFVYSFHGRWVFPLSCGVFLPPLLSEAFQLLVSGFHAPAPARASLVQPGLFVYSSGRDSIPCSSELSVPHPLSRVSLLFLLLISQFLSFFPGWKSVCPGGYADLAQGCLWEYRGTAKLTLSMSSQAIWAQETGGPGALLVSLFHVKWRFSAPTGCVEGSKFCLFSVVLPARCVSIISPRFHYRRHTFCLLPLATILESLQETFNSSFISLMTH
jgi:hypothetical protein